MRYKRSSVVGNHDVCNYLIGGKSLWYCLARISNDQEYFRFAEDMLVIQKLVIIANVFDY